jgi:hypothetical protein
MSLLRRFAFIILSSSALLSLSPCNKTERELNQSLEENQREWKKTAPMEPDL